MLAAVQKHALCLEQQVKADQPHGRMSPSLLWLSALFRISELHTEYSKN